MCAHTMYLNRWSSRDDERRAVMAHARCSWWGMVANRPRALVAYGFSLSTTTTKQSFSRSPLFFFSEDVYILLASSLVIIIHIPTNNNVLLLLLLLLLLLRRSFVRSERAREEKRHKTTTHKHRRKKSLRVAFSVQITRIENAFYFCFLLFRVFVSEKSLNPKPTRIFFPHRGEKCKILLSVCIFIFRTRKHTRTIIHNKYDFCSHFHNRSRRCRVFCV